MKRYLGICFLLALAGCQKSTTTLIQQLQTGNLQDRSHALHALEKRGNEAAVVVPALTDALKDEDYLVRRDAARILRRFGEEAKPAVRALLAAADDNEMSVRRAAVNALKEIEPTAAKKIERR